MSETPVSEDLVLKGSCFCGQVTFEVHSTPTLSAYCHCTICQRLTACPFVHTLHFSPGRVFKWTHPEPHDDRLDYFINPDKPWKRRARCKHCGSGVASYHAKEDRWSVWASQLEREQDGRIKHSELVKPTAHQFYGTRLLDITDGIGKWEGYEGRSKRIT
ncbi:hypothetical protein PLICRDRAFT_101089 [Plicaturopsis crispa FD-325 SS-3]|nr:hypothetical protein PLICRDRAFT_101089 [Plicaturopsis crispa FD-325 SS-3]